jgi:hypothetical protein
VDNVVLGINPGSDSLQVVNLYPNPARSGQNLEIISSGFNTFSVGILNPLGQLVIVQSFENGKAEIPLSGLQPGSYLVRIRSGNSAYIQKLVISAP